MNPQIHIARSIVEKGQVAPVVLPFGKAKEIQQHIQKAGCPAGICFSEPPSHFTGVKVGTTGYLWAVVRNADGTQYGRA